MKKLIFVIASFLLATTTALPCVATLPARTRAQAAASAQDALVLPVSYEQYLPLNAPADVALCNDYTAIAEGTNIYVYDRLHGTYETIDVSPVTNEVVTKIQFAGNDRLYFLDGNMLLHYVELSSCAITDVALPCTTFLIEGNTLYYTTMSGLTSKLFMTDLYQPSILNSQQLDPQNLSGSITLAFWNGELYYTDESHDTNVYKINPETKQLNKIAEFSRLISSMYITNGILACSMTGGSANNAFYTFPLAVPDRITLDDALSFQEGNFSAITAFDNSFYIVEDNSVKQYSTLQNAFTEFEICSASDSRHRLNGATGAYLADNLLLLADNGNMRVSVYDTQTGIYQDPILSSVNPSYIAAYKDTLLVADNNNAVLYSLSKETYGETLFTFNAFNGTLVGVANVYDSYYLVTHNNCFYRLASNDSQTWALNVTQKTTTQYPDQITADAYGVLYILSGNDVYSLTEAQAMDAPANGEKVYTVPTTPNHIQQIAVDYEQCVYALTENCIYSSSQTLTFEQPLVYYADDTQTASLNAFAFGIKENKTYVLCDNTYVIVTERLQLPTVQTVAVNGADEKIFENAQAEFAVMQTNAHTLLVEFDLQTLQNATYFPYVNTERSKTEKNMLKIGETDTHYLLAYFDASINGYRNYLARKADCTQLPDSTYRIDYEENEQTTVYVTSDVQLYKFPYLTDLLTVTTLSRGVQVQLLGAIEQLDHKYYHVTYVNEQGQTQTGYIPQAFTNPFSGIPPQSKPHVSGSTESNRDMIWRLAYLLLGFGAICILGDYVLIRKKKKDETNDIDEE